MCPEAHRVGIAHLVCPSEIPIYPLIHSCLRRDRRHVYVAWSSCHSVAPTSEPIPAYPESIALSRDPRFFGSASGVQLKHIGLSEWSNEAVVGSEDGRISPDDDYLVPGKRSSLNQCSNKKWEVQRWVTGGMTRPERWDRKARGLWAARRAYRWCWKLRLMLKEGFCEHRWWLWGRTGTEWVFRGNSILSQIEVAPSGRIDTIW